MAATYYSPTQQAQINPVVWLPFVDATGNPKVNPEEAKTLTAGFVWRPNTAHEKLNGLNLSVDYYDIKIDGHDLGRRRADGVREVPEPGIEPDL